MTERREVTGGGCGGYPGRMPRAAGTHNKGYEEKRAALLARAAEVVTASPSTRPSLRELSQKLGVSVPTLRHYFGGRDEIVAEVMAGISSKGGPYLKVFSTPSGPLGESIRLALMFVAQGFRNGALDRAHVLGFAEGLHHPMLGPAYLTGLLEPTLAGLEARLAAHRAQGDIAETDDRLMALSLLGPLLLLLLHQGALGGAAVRPADIERFIDGQVAAFVRAYGVRG